MSRFPHAPQWWARAHIPGHTLAPEGGKFTRRRGHAAKSRRAISRWPSEMVIVMRPRGVWAARVGF